jgi:hypothetical protein
VICTLASRRWRCSTPKLEKWRIVDGYLYYSKSFRSDEIWKIAVDGGPESLVFKEPDLDCFCNWALAPTGINLIAEKPGQQRSLSFYDFSLRTITELFAFRKILDRPCPSA